jgi:hypothetical protein
MLIRFEFEVDAAYTQETWKFRVLLGLRPHGGGGDMRNRVLFRAMIVTCAPVECDVGFRAYAADANA